MARDYENEAVTDYWMEHYCGDHCTLCGNSGVIDSRGVRTAAGFEVGRLNWCVCPNGQAIRAQVKGLPKDTRRGPRTMKVKRIVGRKIVEESVPIPFFQQDSGVCTECEGTGREPGRHNLICEVYRGSGREEA